MQPTAVVGDGDIESGTREDHSEIHPPGARRKRRVSTLLLLSGGPLANHHAGDIPEQLKPQDSMTSVERVDSLIASSLPFSLHFIFSSRCINSKTRPMPRRRSNF
jgi:hypothetical protein